MSKCQICKGLLKTEPGRFIDFCFKCNLFTDKRAYIKEYQFIFFFKDKIDNSILNLELFDFDFLPKSDIIVYSYYLKKFYFVSQKLNFRSFRNAVVRSTINVIAPQINELKINTLNKIKLEKAFETYKKLELLK